MRTARLAETARTTGRRRVLRASSGHSSLVSVVVLPGSKRVWEQQQPRALAFTFRHVSLIKIWRASEGMLGLYRAGRRVGRAACYVGDRCCDIVFLSRKIVV